MFVNFLPPEGFRHKILKLGKKIKNPFEISMELGK